MTWELSGQSPGKCEGLAVNRGSAPRSVRPNIAPANQIHLFFSYFDRICTTDVTMEGVCWIVSTGLLSPWSQLITALLCGCKFFESSSFQYLDSPHSFRSICEAIESGDCVCRLKLKTFPARNIWIETPTGFHVYTEQDTQNTYCTHNLKWTNGMNQVKWFSFAFRSSSSHKWSSLKASLKHHCTQK